MINQSAKGIYVAYPRSRNCTTTRGNADTLVNCQHTKVGFTAESFQASSYQYRMAFNSQIKFIPVAEIPASEIDQVKKALLAELNARYSRVGATLDWYDTQDRETIISMIYALLSPAANDDSTDRKSDLG